MSIHSTSLHRCIINEQNMFSAIVTHCSFTIKRFTKIRILHTYTY